MAVVLKGKMTGTSVSEVTHPSGAVVKIVMSDQGFMASELVAAALGACTAANIRIYAENHGIKLESLEYEITKEMHESPSSIKKLTNDFKLRGTFSDTDLEKLKAAAKNCAVGRTLEKSVEIVNTFTVL